MTSVVSARFYHAIPDLEDRQARVYDCIQRNYDMTALDVARHLHMTPQNVRCRITELLRQGRIVRTGKRKDRLTGHTNTTYAAAVEAVR